jgi:hypothetical protein
VVVVVVVVVVVAVDLQAHQLLVLFISLHPTAYTKSCNSQYIEELKVRYKLQSEM